MNAPFKVPPPSDPAQPPLWDLSDLYASRADAKIETDLEAARLAVSDLNGLQGRFVADRADPAALGASLDRAITLYEHATERLGALGAYAFLAASTARDDASAQGFEADLREKITAIATPTVWLTLEINQLDEAEIEAALSADAEAATATRTRRVCTPASASDSTVEATATARNRSLPPSPHIDRRSSHRWASRSSPAACHCCLSHIVSPSSSDEEPPKFLKKSPIP
jgi:hypothetical protein